MNDWEKYVKEKDKNDELFFSEPKFKFIGTDDYQVKWGNNDDPRPLMVIGQEYTLINKEVHSWHTKYMFKEFPGKKFNSVAFREVIS